MGLEAVNNFLLKIFGSKNERLIKGYLPVVEAINALESDVRALAMRALTGQTGKLKSRLTSGEPGRCCRRLLPQFGKPPGALGMRHF
ncbi:MAG: hypothetical protein R2860_04935 [Desulfobacterales bacterium]